MPALNEAENLRWLLPQVASRYRVVVVDNGSTDDTMAVAAGQGCEVVRCPERGYGNAVLAGIRHIEWTREVPRALAILDADGTSPWEDIGRLAAPVLAGDRDLVIGQRCERLDGAMPLHALLGNRLTVTLIGWLTGRRYLDMGPLRVISGEALQRLGMRDPTWGWNVEMQMKAAQLGLRVEEMGVRYAPRRHGRSKISGSLIGSVRAGSRMMMSVGVYWWEGRKLVARMRPIAGA